jgi:hypothetical protein
MDVRGDRTGQSRVDGQEARLRYAHGDFVIMTGGSFVRCAVTGRPIPLEGLRYWSVARQEAYYSPAEAVQNLASSE